jgi:hypothetical protein
MNIVQSRDTEECFQVKEVKGFYKLNGAIRGTILNKKNLKRYISNGELIVRSDTDNIFKELMEEK